MNFRHFPKSVNKAIAAAYKKGATLQKLAKKHKCSTAKVRRVLLTLKVVMRSRGPKAKKASKPKLNKLIKKYVAAEAEVIAAREAAIKRVKAKAIG